MRPKFFVQYIPRGKTSELSLETAGGMVFDHKLLSIGQDTEGPALPPQTRPAIVAAIRVAVLTITFEMLADVRRNFMKRVVL